MNKYIVTYTTLALRNSEIEVSPPDADKMRELISARKDYQPLIFGRDWEWVPITRTVVIEAQSYSVKDCVANFYMDIPADAGRGYSTPRSECIASVVGVTTVVREGTGSFGNTPWEPWKDVHYRKDTGGPQQELQDRGLYPEDPLA